MAVTGAISVQFDEVFPHGAFVVSEVEQARLQGYVVMFIRLFLQSIYKWVQSQLSLHIGNLDLDRERAMQLPVVTGSEWTRG